MVSSEAINRSTGRPIARLLTPAAIHSYSRRCYCCNSVPDECRHGGNRMPKHTLTRCSTNNCIESHSHSHAWHPVLLISLGTLSPFLLLSSPLADDATLSGFGPSWLFEHCSAFVGYYGVFFFFSFRDTAAAHIRCQSGCWPSKWHCHNGYYLCLFIVLYLFLSAYQRCCAALRSLYRHFTCLRFSPGMLKFVSEEMGGDKANSIL